MASPTATRPTLLSLEGRDLPSANLQLINQSPYAAAAAIDIYLNNSKILNDVPFRQATAFLSVADSAPLKIDVVSAAATDNKSPLFTRTLTLAPNSHAVAAVVGDPADSTSGGKFGLAVTLAARPVASSAVSADVAVLQASPDAPAIDVKFRNAGAFADNIPYGVFANGYSPVAPGKYVVDVTRADGVTPVGSFNLDLTGAAGTARTLILSGFAAPKFPTDPPLALVTVDGKGFGTVLTRAAAFAATKYAVGGDGTATLYNFDGTPGVKATLPPTAAGLPRLNSERVAVGDVNADGVPDLVVAVGPGGPDPQHSLAGIDQVAVYDGATGATLKAFTPFEASFTGGLFVAVGDINNDGYADIVLTADQGGGPRVQVLSGKTFAPLVPDFLGIADAAFRGGARPAVADVNGDGTPDLVVAAGFGGGPRVAVFNGLSLLPGGAPGRLLPDFFAFEDTLRNGAYVAAGDVDGDGLADIVAGGGPGGGPRVLVLGARELLAATSVRAPLANFFAWDPAGRDGVRVAAKDLDGDYRADLVVGIGPNGVANSVRTFAGKSLPLTGAATALAEFAAPSTAGVFVG